ncbi:unnamed protein product, partial [Iphiclides podalirius]
MPIKQLYQSVVYGISRSAGAILSVATAATVRRVALYRFADAPQPTDYFGAGARGSLFPLRDSAIPKRQPSRYLPTPF